MGRTGGVLRLLIGIVAYKGRRPFGKPSDRIDILRLHEQPEIDDLITRIGERVAHCRRGDVERRPTVRRELNHRGAVDHEGVGGRVEARACDRVAEHVIGPRERGQQRDVDAALQ